MQDQVKELDIECCLHYYHADVEQSHVQYEHMHYLVDRLWVLDCSILKYFGGIQIAFGNDQVCPTASVSFAVTSIHMHKSICILQLDS